MTRTLETLAERMRKFTFSTWGGTEKTVDATHVRFEHTHVVFLIDERIVLAERAENVNRLREHWGEPDEDDPTATGGCR